MPVATVANAKDAPSVPPYREFSFASTMWPLNLHILRTNDGKERDFGANDPLPRTWAVRVEKKVRPWTWQRLRGYRRAAQRRKCGAQSVQLGAARTGVELFLDKGIAFKAKFVRAFEALVARRRRQRRIVRHTLSTRLGGFGGERQCARKAGRG